VSYASRILDRSRNRRGGERKAVEERIDRFLKADSKPKKNAPRRKGSW
jgi:hypothetical protein